MLRRLAFALIATGLVSACDMGRLAPDDELRMASEMTARERAEADLDRMYYGGEAVAANGCPPSASVMYRGKRYCVGLKR